MLRPVRSGVLVASALVVSAFVVAPCAFAQIQAYTFNGASAGNQFGAVVRNAFDVDHDGFDDVIVGEPLANPNGNNSGRARVYSGKTGALLWTFDGESAGDQFGSAVAGIGDVDFDGYGDLAVGAPQADSPYVDAGAVYFFSGRTGLEFFALVSNQANSRFGASVASAGDVDNDGKLDVIAGLPFSNSGGVSAGGFVLISGVNLLPFPNGTFFGTQTGSLLGWSVAAAGNIDHDGHDDVIVGAPFAGPNNEGQVYVFSGADGSLLYTKTGLSTNSQFGYSVSGQRDIDHDGWADFVVGAPFDTPNGVASGRVRVFSGHNGNLLHSIDGSNGFHFGLSVSAINDIDGDGFDDFVVGAPYGDHNSQQETGVVRVFSGQTGNILHSFFGDNAGDRLGWSVSRGGDINNDGTSDVIAGAPLASPNGANSGLAHVWFMGCPKPVTYCTAKTNSAGCVPQIDHTGVPTRVTGADDFVITASNVLTGKNGIMFWGLQALSTPFYGGTLCVHAPTIRTPIQNSGCPSCAACQGSYAFAFDHAYMASYSVQAGDTLYAQFWSRDPGFTPPNSIGLTDALQFTVCK